MSSTASPSADGKTWLVTAATSPLGYSVAREALRNGDRVVAGCSLQEYNTWNASCPDFDNQNGTDKDQDHNLSSNHRSTKIKIVDDGDGLETLDVDSLYRIGAKSCIVVPLETKVLSSCQAALADALEAFGRIDILFNCTSSTYCGSLEEYSEWHARDQLEVAFYGSVNIIRTIVREMREKEVGGHIVNVTSLAAQIGTPGLSLLTAAHHAQEGFIEALAFEIAPFNIKITNVEPSLMTYLLTNPIHLLPAAASNSDEAGVDGTGDGNKFDHEDDDEDDEVRYPLGASQLRKIFEPIMPEPSNKQQPSEDSSIATLPFPRTLKYPSLTASAQLDLVSETSRIVMAIAGKENPPGRIIVGGEEGIDDGEGGVQSIKERMKTVSEELEEFLQCALSVDTPNIVTDSSMDD